MHVLLYIFINVAVDKEKKEKTQVCLGQEGVIYRSDT